MAAPPPLIPTGPRGIRKRGTITNPAPYTTTALPPLTTTSSLRDSDGIPTSLARSQGVDVRARNKQRAASSRARVAARRRKSAAAQAAEITDVESLQSTPTLDRERNRLNRFIDTQANESALDDSDVKKWSFASLYEDTHVTVDPEILALNQMTCADEASWQDRWTTQPVISSMTPKCASNVLSPQTTPLQFFLARRRKAECVPAAVLPTTNSTATTSPELTLMAVAIKTLDSAAISTQKTIHAVLTQLSRLSEQVTLGEKMTRCIANYRTELRTLHSAGPPPFKTESLQRLFLTADESNTVYHGMMSCNTMTTSANLSQPQPTYSEGYHLWIVPKYAACIYYTTNNPVQCQFWVLPNAVPSQKARDANVELFSRY